MIKDFARIKATVKTKAKLIEVRLKVLLIHDKCLKYRLLHYQSLCVKILRILPCLLYSKQGDNRLAKIIMNVTSVPHPDPEAFIEHFARLGLKRYEKELAKKALAIS